MSPPKAVAIAGGTGSAKLLRGLSEIDCELAVVSNVGDNLWVYGVYVCPDIDIAMYALSGVSSKKRKWGIEADTFRFVAQQRRQGKESWFRLGDLDRENSEMRTKWLRQGLTLTDATARLCRRYHVRQPILPVSDDPLETRVVVKGGELHLQEFWVREGGKPAVKGVRYDGAPNSRPTQEASREILSADIVILCPANPVSSIGPVLAVPGVRRLLASTRARVVALSPMVGAGPFSGPAGKLMRALGVQANSIGVAEMYADFVDEIVIDSSDATMAARIEKLGVRCRLSDTRMSLKGDSRRLARELLEA